jgi:hypothetical protein
LDSETDASFRKGLDVPPLEWMATLSKESVSAGALTAEAPFPVTVGLDALG